MASCRVCVSNQADEVPTATRTLMYNCPRCGNYGITFEALESEESLSVKDRLRASRYILEQNILKNEPRITNDYFEYIKTLRSIRII
jgi:hypothetical protein